MENSYWNKHYLALVLCTLVMFVINNSVHAHKFYLDLTHPSPTFQPLDGDMNKPDMSKPHGDSDPRGIPSFGPQTVFMINPKFDTGQGYFYSGRSATSEHHGTHIDAHVHYVNNEDTIEVVCLQKNIYMKCYLMI